MSLKRKFDYTSETMFKRANKLASDCGADVLVVVRYHGDFSIYRNVGVDWAQQLDINHLERQLSSDQTDFRILRPASFVNGEALVACQGAEPRAPSTAGDMIANGSTSNEGELDIDMNQDLGAQMSSPFDFPQSGLETVEEGAKDPFAAPPEPANDLGSGLSPEQWDVFAMELGTPRNAAPLAVDTTIDPSLLSLTGTGDATEDWPLPAFDVDIDGALSASLAGLGLEWDMLSKPGDMTKDHAGGGSLGDWQAYDDYEAIQGLETVHAAALDDASEQ